MEHLVTPAAATAPTNPIEVAPHIPPSSSDPEQRRRRILALREVIETGEYHVGAGDLADALLRFVRRAN